MIVENQFTDQLIDIFDENNQDFISDREVVKRGFLNVVFEENNIALGYAVVYFGKDFCEQENYPIVIDNIKDNSIYIWQMATKKGYENKGIGTKIIKYISEKFKDRDIYSAIDIENLGSIRVHEKCGFKIVKKFEKKCNNKNESYVIVIKNNSESKLK